jgi:predicted aldo/keto reductase-like oxidoreductase
MRYRQLGRTGFEVSEISLGTVEIGMPYGIGKDGEPSPPDEAEASRLLHSTLDLGVNLIDTARIYGESEAIIGRALRTAGKNFFSYRRFAPIKTRIWTPRRCGSGSPPRFIRACLCCKPTSST